jgi:hypothetical protein
MAEGSGMGIGLAQQAWAVEGARIEGVESGAAAPSLRQSGVERNAVPKATASKAPAAIAAFASSAGYGTLHASTPRKEGRTLGVSTSPRCWPSRSAPIPCSLQGEVRLVAIAVG